MSNERLTGEIVFNNDGTANIVTDTGEVLIFDDDGSLHHFDYILKDPQIFDEEARQKYDELPHGERDPFLIELLKGFYRSNPEYAYFVQEQIYKEPLLLLNFFKGVSREHLKKCKIKAGKFKELGKRIETAEKAIQESPINYSDMKISHIWPILRIRDIFTESELAALYYIQNPREEEAGIDSVIIKRANKIELPIDKPNHFIWGSLETNTDGQLTINFNTLPDTPEKDALIFYSIDFNSLGDKVNITKKLTPFDKRVYISTAALFNAGNNIVTLSQIYYAMGYVGRPGKPDLEKLSKSITKMNSADIILDTSKEAKAIDGYREYFYKGKLLPMEEIIAVVNGKITESAIHLFREPPLMTFAKERKQITTVNLKILQSPISKTDANILIDDYLIERIQRGKRAKHSQLTILLDTLYENTNITTYKQRERAPGKIKKYLKHYKDVEAIKGYKITDKKIVIEL